MHNGSTDITEILPNHAEVMAIMLAACLATPPCASPYRHAAVTMLLQVLLHGAPDWESCLAVVNAVVNASAPCAVHAHLPACVLGTPQPELQGNFMALTGW